LINLLEGLVVLDLPGGVLPQLRKLHARLEIVIDGREKRNVDSITEE
jgi:hypothetical protein